MYTNKYRQKHILRYSTSSKLQTPRKIDLTNIGFLSNSNGGYAEGKARKMVDVNVKSIL